MSEHRDIGEIATPAASPAPAGRNVVAVIGIDDYVHWQPLCNAANDARGVRDTFGKLGFEAVAALFDGEATRGAIEELLDELDGTLAPLDRLVVFFSGHGYAITQQLAGTPVTTGYLIPVDGEHEARRKAGWIELDGLLRKISKLPPLHVLVILDACYAGSALTCVLGARGSGSLTHQPFDALHKRMSRVVIASSLDDETARDGGPEPGHSLFTHFLLDALNGGMPGMSLGDGRRVIHGSELGHHVRKAVQTYRGDIGCRQTPDVGGFGHHRRGEMPIFCAGDGSVAAPPNVFAEGSSPTLPAETSTTRPSMSYEAMIASEPAFAVGTGKRPAPSPPTTATQQASPPPPPSAPTPSRPVATLPPPGTTQRAASSREIPKAADLAPLSSRFTSAASSDPIGAARRESRTPSPTMLAGIAALVLAAGLPLGWHLGRRTSLVPATVAVIEPADDEAVAMKGTGTMRLEKVAPKPVPRPAPPREPRREPPRETEPPADESKPPPSSPSQRLCVVDLGIFPGGVEVWQGSLLLGKRAYRAFHVELPCGVETTLEFRKPHYNTVSRTLIPTTEGVRVSVQLTPIVYLVTVSSEPAGAAIHFGNKVLGTTPATVHIPAAATTALVLTKDGYTAASASFEPADGRLVSATLQRAP